MKAKFSCLRIDLLGNDAVCSVVVYLTTLSGAQATS
jgi:hypothetical protein